MHHTAPCSSAFQTHARAISSPRAATDGPTAHALPVLCLLMVLARLAVRHDEPPRAHYMASTMAAGSASPALPVVILRAVVSGLAMAALLLPSSSCSCSRSRSGSCFWSLSLSSVASSSSATNQRPAPAPCLPACMRGCVLPCFRTRSTSIRIGIPRRLVLFRPSLA